MRIEKETSGKHDYGCLMVNVEYPEITYIHSLIKTGDIYFGDDVNRYGLEDEPHVTLLYGLLPEVKLDDIIPYLSEFNIKGVYVTGISVFENEEFDVLKLDIAMDELGLINRVLSENLPVVPSEHSYNPHLTLAYLHKGTGQMYVDKIGQIKGRLIFDHFSFTTPNLEKYKIYK